MSEVEHRCPDCGVTMEPTDPITDGGQSVKLRTDDRQEGLLGRIGVHERLDVTAHVCPECGLVRWYADVEE
ncbi:hypothetical protein BRD18_07065 [Halobacteriales archaeon SW_7_71_33]|nr:MAG: hypothetical protein BRD18_07065 [Halobacteriales archaeon SW_7_71_33]